jgi:hypothetical protein
MLPISIIKRHRYFFIWIKFSRGKNLVKEGCEVKIQFENIIVNSLQALRSRDCEYEKHGNGD